jgi:exodeoxyribonuclease VII small subunit
MEDLKFKEALNSLEEILKILEEGDLSLEEMLEKYEEGVALTNLCNKKLNQAKKKIKILFEKNSKFITKDFEDKEK